MVKTKMISIPSSSTATTTTTTATIAASTATITTTRSSSLIVSSLTSLLPDIKAYDYNTVTSNQFELEFNDIIQKIIHGTYKSVQLIELLKSLEITSDNLTVSLCISNVLWLWGTQVYIRIYIKMHLIYFFIILHTSICIRTIDLTHHQ